MDSVIDHTTSISKHNPLARNSYIKLPKELDHPRKGLINIRNIEDNECFKWSIIRRITKTDIDFTKKLGFKNIRYSVKVKDIHKIKGKNYIDISVTLIIYADFESILVPETTGKQNPEESYTNKYQKHIVCSYGYN